MSIESQTAPPEGLFRPESPEWLRAQQDLRVALPMLDFLSRRELKVEFRRPLPDGSFSTGFDVSMYKMGTTDPSNLNSYLGYWKISHPGGSEPDFKDARLEAVPTPQGTRFRLLRTEISPDGSKKIVDAPLDELVDRAATLRYAATNIPYETAFPESQRAMKNELKQSAHTGFRKIVRTVLNKSIGRPK